MLLALTTNFQLFHKKLWPKLAFIIYLKIYILSPKTINTFNVLYISGEKWD